MVAERFHNALDTDDLGRAEYYGDELDRRDRRNDRMIRGNAPSEPVQRASEGWPFQSPLKDKDLSDISAQHLKVYLMAAKRKGDQQSMDVILRVARRRGLKWALEYRVGGEGNRG